MGWGLYQLNCSFRILSRILAFKSYHLIVDGIGIDEVKFINAANLLRAKLNSQIVKYLLEKILINFLQSAFTYVVSLLTLIVHSSLVYIL